MQIINSALAFYITIIITITVIIIMFLWWGFFDFFFRDVLVQLGYLSRCCAWATRWTTKEPQFDFKHRQQTFLFPKASRRDLVPIQLPTWPVTVDLSPEYSGRSEADHLPSSSAKFKNDWSCTATSPYAFMACIATILALPLPLVFAVLRTRRRTFRFQLCYRLFFFINRGYINFFPTSNKM